jgi:hypothetical protein
MILGDGVQWKGRQRAAQMMFIGSKVTAIDRNESDVTKLLSVFELRTWQTRDTWKGRSLNNTRGHRPSISFPLPADAID